MGVSIRPLDFLGVHGQGHKPGQSMFLGFDGDSPLKIPSSLGSAGGARPPFAEHSGEYPTLHAALGNNPDECIISTGVDAVVLLLIKRRGGHPRPPFGSGFG